MIVEVKTETGCTVRFQPSPYSHLPGFLLTLDMETDGDRRHAEVVLTRDEAAELISESFRLAAKDKK